MDLRLCLILTVCLHVSPIFAESDIPKLGVEGQSATLPCNLPFSDPAQVTWTDMVHNSDDNPELIFNSTNNPSRRISSTHPGVQNFQVQQDYSLIVRNFNMETGTGRYTCTSIVNGQAKSITYYLNVHERSVLNCTGKTQLMENEATELNCAGHYQGNLPNLAWYEGEGEGAEVSSKDGFELRLARRTLILSAVSYKDDGKRFTCRMKLGDTTKECSVTLSVKHLVRDVRFSPDVTSLHAGEELRCLASGNPAPRIEIEPSTAADKSGVGMRAIVLEKEWAGKQITVKCTASNSLNGYHEVVVRNITINVKEEKPQAGASGDGGNTLGIVVGLVIAILLLVAIVIAVILVRRRKSQKPPKGAKPLPTKEQISHSQNGQSSQRGQPV